MPKALKKMNRYILLAVVTLILFTLSCGSKPVDVRLWVPADSLAYLRSDDLGKAMSALTAAPSFKHLSRSQPDLSALNGIRLAVAVTGFETSESPVDHESSVLNFQPRFVAIVETNAWNYQALKFTEERLGEFVNERYGGGIELETNDRPDGRYFVWTAEDGRKAFALVNGSVIFFGNDESAIEKCLAVKRGEAEGLKPYDDSQGTLASAYISPDGVAQISNLVGIQFAMTGGEEGEVQSFIARVLPQMIRGAVNDVKWTATAVEGGIDDRFVVSGTGDTARLFAETMAPGDGSDAALTALVPAGVVSATRYGIKDPQVAWRSVVLTGQKSTDQMSGALIAGFSSSLFEPYGVEQDEAFLSSVGPHIVTAKFDAEGNDVVVITTIRDKDRMRSSLAKELSLSRTPEKIGDADVWRSDDGDLAAAILGDILILGDADSVAKCLGTKTGEALNNKMFMEAKASSVTFGKDSEIAAKIVDALSERKNAEENFPVTYLTETRFNLNGMERRTVSEYGMMGTILFNLK